MAHKQTLQFDPKAFFAKVGRGKTVLECREKEIIFSQGDAADAVFHIQSGKVKLTVVSKRGKEAVVAILEPDSFLGEACLAGQLVRFSTATCAEPCILIRLERERMVRLLREESTFAAFFMSHLLSRTIRVEEDLVDQLFNSSEKRLARALLLLAHYGKEAKPETIIGSISQETLAEMVGTTRSRISFFMNKFRRLGFIDYNGGLQVHSSLLNIVLHD